jgi:hypothetical protein
VISGWTKPVRRSGQRGPAQDAGLPLEAILLIVPSESDRSVEDRPKYLPLPPLVRPRFHSRSGAERVGVKSETQDTSRVKTIPPYNDEDRELEEEIRTFEKFRDIDDDDRAAGTRVPIPRKPNPQDAAIALPELDEDEGNS